MKTSISFARLSIPACLSALVSFTAHAACDKPVDPTRAVIFVGLNQSLLEVKAAEEAACTRGETFVVLPKPVDGVDQATIDLGMKIRIENQMQDVRDKYMDLDCAEGNPMSNTCRALLDRLQLMGIEKAKVEASFDAYWQRYYQSMRGLAISDLFLETLRELASKNIRITTLILSGHSGGKGIWGAVGSGGIQFDSVQNMIKAIYKDKLNLLSDFNSILLWGCNTINPFNAAGQWTKFHPTLRLLFGFQGSAPGAKNAASPALLRNIMNGEQALARITRQENPEAEIKNHFDRTRGIDYTIGSAFINSPERKRGWYYERSFVKSKDPAVKDVWTSVVTDKVSCEDIVDQLKEDQALAQRYLKGEIAIPADTGSGELRELYTRSRRNESCRFSMGYALNSDQVGYLLFWNDLKKNAARFLNPNGSNPVQKIRTLSDENTLKDLINRSTENSTEAKASAIAKLEKEVEKNRLSIAAFSDEIALYQELDSPYEWKPRDERRLKRLTKKVARLSRKPKKAEKYLRFKTELELKIKTKAIATAANPVEALRLALAALTEKQNMASAVIDTLNRQIQDLRSGRNTEVQAQELRTQLVALLQSLPPSSVAEITPMSINDLRAKVTGARPLLQNAQSATQELSSLAPLNKALRSLDTWLTAYSKLTLELRPECLDFPTWHEYLEAPGAQTPTSRCFDASQLN